jgi:hypothetical protein
MSQAEVLRFWHAVEMFAPPHPAEVDAAGRVFAVSPDSPLPWEAGHELAAAPLPPDRQWRHLVYLGIFPLSTLFDLLAAVSRPDADEFGEPPGGESALAALVLSADGRAALGPPLLSGCAWAAARLLRPGTSDPLRGFDAARADFGRAVAGLRARRLDVAGLRACRDSAARIIGVGERLPAAEIRVHSCVVPRGSRRVPEDCLNGVVPADLARIAEQVDQGTIGAALRHYLGPGPDRVRRVDLRHEPGAAAAAAAPHRVPLGRWPVAPERAQSRARQVAVNGAHGIDAAAPIFGVHAPQGTGIVEVLRDLVAEVVVRRACALAALARPQEAFTGEKGGWHTGPRARVAHLWQPEFDGFEMVVAAAQADSAELGLSAHAAVDDCWRADAALLDYFAELGSALSADPDAGPPAATISDADRAPAAPDAAWALLVASLHGEHSRDHFAAMFWRDGLWAMLNRYHRYGPSQSWADAVEQFRCALDRATAMRDDREYVSRCLEHLPEVEQRLCAASRALADAEQREIAARDRLLDVHRHIAAWQREYECRQRSRREHARARPPAEQAATVPAAMRQWRCRDSELGSEIVVAERELGAAHTEQLRLGAEAEHAARAVGRARDTLRCREQELAVLTDTVERAEAHLGEHFPRETRIADRARRETVALWTDPEWNQVRSELFLSALHLHKVFVEHVPSQMRQSLHALSDILAGAAPADLDSRIAQACWQALFFVVPVVSTTFASFSGLFASVGCEGLGWLLVPDAGRVRPSEAAAALWRSKRAVVAGDTLDLEPVEVLPASAERLIRSHHRVDARHGCAGNSLQQLVDRHARVGALLSPAADPVWVGVPLTLRDGPDQPMFDIVNDIAYDGMLWRVADDGAEAFARRRPALPPSAWIDTPAPEAQGPCQQRECAQLDALLAELATAGFPMSEVMALTPFRDVAGQLRGRAHAYPGLTAGTVRVAAARQADVVILVLGGDPSRTAVRRWAARRPNLINVAVGRARRRLYVIGDRELWSAHRHFDTLARLLPPR